MKKDSYFDYYDGKEETNNAFRIGASQVSKFFDSTSEWYREKLLGEEGFQGNTASTLGTIVHAGIEMFVLEGSVDHNAIDSYIRQLKDPEIDFYHIKEQYPTMLDTILPYVKQNMPDEVEKFVFHEILPGIGAGGSIDAINYFNKGKNAYLRDWKTTAMKSLPSKFSRAYWFQQMTYAWVLKQLGIEVNYLELVYISTSDMNRVSEKTGKALKSYPSVYSVVREEVTEQGLELIGSCLKLIAESVQTWNNNEELRYLLAQDYRLKIKPPAKLFIEEGV